MVSIWSYNAFMKQKTLVFIRVTLFSAVICNFCNKNRYPKFCRLYVLLQKAMKMHASIN